MIVLRKISLGDFFLLFRWVNNQESTTFTRKFTKTSLVSHAKWFLQNYKSDQHLMYKIHDRVTNNDVGIIQLLIADSSAELRIKLIEPSLRGRGFGSQALLSLIEIANAKGLTFIYLFVRRDNQAAVKLYQKYGFRFVPNSDFLGEYSDGFFTTSKMILELD